MFCSAVLFVLVFYSAANSLTQARVLFIGRKFVTHCSNCFRWIHFWPFIMALTKLPDRGREHSLRNVFVIESILLHVILWIDVTSLVSLKWTPGSFNVSRWETSRSQSCWGQRWFQGHCPVNRLRQVCLRWHTDVFCPATNKSQSNLTGNLFGDPSLGKLEIRQTQIRPD